MKVLAKHDGSAIYCDLTRVLISNSQRQRKRSHEARHELRQVLTELEADGYLRLSPTAKPGRAGRPGLRIEVVKQPKSSSTPEEGIENVER